MILNLQLSFTFLISLCFSAETKSLHTDIPFPKDPGLFYEQLTTVRLKTDKWNIMTYINVDQISQIDSHLKDIFDELTPFCKDTYETNHCLTVLKTQEETRSHVQNIMTNIHIIDFQPSDWHHHSTHAIPSTLNEIIIRFRNLNETLIRRNSWDSSIVRYKSFASL